VNLAISSSKKVRIYCQIFSLKKFILLLSDISLKKTLVRMGVMGERCVTFRKKGKNALVSHCSESSLYVLWAVVILKSDINLNLKCFKRAKFDSHLLNSRLIVLSIVISKFLQCTILPQ
jgi:hypothetical protein